MALILGAISDAQGWFRVMACIESLPVGLIVLRGGRSTGQGHRRAGAGFDLGVDAGNCRGLDDVMTTVVLAADTVQALGVDGVGHANGRLEFLAAGNAVGHSFTSWI